jgi:hypothetical protein
VRPVLRQIGLIGALGLLAIAPRGWAQVSAGELQMTLNADLSFGYNAFFGDQIPGSHNIGFGGAANMKGYYFDPKFLTFSVAPYYSLSRLNSNYSSDFDASGVSASVQLFSGGHTPGSFSFNKDWNSEGEFGIPELGSFRTQGQGQSFGVGWGLSFPKYPSFDIGYNFGNGSSQVLGTTTTEHSDFSTLTLGTGYQLYGFLMNATYLKSHVSQDLPEVLDFSSLTNGSTSQDTVQVNVSHRLPLNGNFQTYLTRTDFTSDFGGTSVNETFDNISTGLTMIPVSRLTVGVNAGYTDNLADALLEPILPTAPSAVTRLGGASSSSFDLSGIATYAVTKQFNVVGWVDYRRQNIYGLDLTSNLYSVSTNYSRPLFGGLLGLYGGVSHYSSSSANSGQIGTTESISYARRIGAWSTSGSFHSSRNQQTAIATYTQSGYGYAFSLDRMVGAWRWNVTAAGSESALDGLSYSSTFSHNYNTSFTGGRLTFAASYARSSGNAIQTATGLVSTPVVAPLVPATLLFFYGGTAYGAGASFHPTGRLNFTGSYSQTTYNTQASSDIFENRARQANFVGDYFYRQMHFVAGYNYLYQAIGAGTNIPANYQSLFVGVTRHFDFF